MITIGISFIVKSFKPLNIYLYTHLLEMRVVLFAVIILMEIVDCNLHFKKTMFFKLHKMNLLPYSQLEASLDI